MFKLVEGLPLEDAMILDRADVNLIEEEINKIIKEKPGLRPNAYMGLVMAKFKGKLDAKKAMEIINRLIS